MARTTNKLTDTYVKASSLKVGRHSDGGGLYVNVTATGTRSWLFMWVNAGRRREMGLGSYPAVSLASARKVATSHRETVANGGDPIAERTRAAVPTFGDCVDQFLASMEGSWRNEKHRAQWRMTLREYCRRLNGRVVSTVATEDVLAVLKPIWQEKPETASRLRGRIERVLDYAAVRGWRSGENPARWRGHLKSILPPRAKLTRGHHAAMPYGQVPEFVERLQQSEAMAARALEFLILTAARSSEVLGSTWSEIDWVDRKWVVSEERMKAAREHRVPLTERAISILKPLYEARVSEFIFFGQRPKRPLSASAMEMLLRRLKVDQFTTHGFRSSFRDWVGDRTSFPREIAEAALAHRVGDATEQAYRRTDAFEKRRKLMEAWERYCLTAPATTVVDIKSRRRS